MTEMPTQWKRIAHGVNLSAQSFSSLCLHALHWFTMAFSNLPDCNTQNDLISEKALQKLSQEVEPSLAP